MNRKQTTPKCETDKKVLRPWCASCALKQEDRLLGSFETLPDVDKGIELVFLDKQIKVLEQEFAEKANIYLKKTEPEPEGCAVADTACSVEELAEKLQEYGVDIGRNQLFKWLRDNGYARYSNGSAYQNLPTEEALEKNYLITVQVLYRKKRTGKLMHSLRIRVTPLGQDFFGRALMAEYGTASKAVRQ